MTTPRFTPSVPGDGSPDPPWERLLRCGGQSLSDSELVAVLLRAGRPGHSVGFQARELLDACGGLAGLSGIDRSTLAQRGLVPARAAVLLAAVELSRRLARACLPDRELLKSTQTVARYLAMRYARADQEIVGALFLDAKLRLIADVELYRGTLFRAVVEPRRVLKEALVRDAAAFVLFHTHPSGDPAPSSEDLDFTRQLAAASEIMEIEMMDHLIVGSAGRWVSLGRRGVW